MSRSYQYILLTIMTIAVVTIAIVEIVKYRHGPGGKGTFYSKDGEIYSGEIYAEQTRSRSEIVAEMPKTTMQFYETKFNFGTISAGKVLTHVFRFKNTGQNALMIAKCDVTCGCTVPDFQKDAIAPGSDGEITIVYNSAEHSGVQDKSIIVHSNALPESVTISIEADVR